MLINILLFFCFVLINFTDNKMQRQKSTLILSAQCFDKYWQLCTVSFLMATRTTPYYSDFCLLGHRA